VNELLAEVWSAAARSVFGDATECVPTGADNVRITLPPGSGWPRAFHVRIESRSELERQGSRTEHKDPSLQRELVESLEHLRDALAALTERAQEGHLLAEAVHFAYFGPARVSMSGD
jgi:hypothetical protein